MLKSEFEQEKITIETWGLKVGKIMENSNNSVWMKQEFELTEVERDTGEIGKFYFICHSF